MNAALGGYRSGETEDDVGAQRPRVPLEFAQHERPGTTLGFHVVMRARDISWPLDDELAFDSRFSGAGREVRGGSGRAWFVHRFVLGTRVLQGASVGRGQRLFPRRVWSAHKETLASGAGAPHKEASVWRGSTKARVASGR